MRNDHGFRRVEELQHAERTRVGKEQVDDQTRHNWRKSHQCIQDGGYRAPSREAVHRQHATYSKADEGGEGHRR